MATSPYGGFADLSRYQLAAAQPTVSPLDALIQGVQQGVAIRQLPQTIQQNALEQQLQAAIQQAKLQELQQGKIFEVGRSLVRRNPTTGEFENLFTAPESTTAARLAPFQLVGSAGQGGPILSFDPNINALTTPTLPPGVTVSGPLLPKTLTPESQRPLGFNEAGELMQFGSRGSGLTTAPTQPGTTTSGPLQPITNRPKTKQILATNEKTGRVTNIELGSGEALPEGFKQITKEGSDFKNIQSLRKEIADNDVVKQFTDVQKSKQRIDVALDEARATNNFTVVDQALISSFNRLLEPDSVTMVSEYARTSADAPIINRIKANITRITQGGRLSPEERAAISRLSDRIYQTSLGNYSKTLDFYEGIGERSGFDLNDIIQPLVPAGQLPIPGSATSVTPAPTPASPIQIKSIRRKQ